MKNGTARMILGSGSNPASMAEERKTIDPVFSFVCDWDGKGKIFRKQEYTPLGKAEYRYSYDDKGHLTEVQRNARRIESYAYNREGRRIEDFRASSGGSRHFIYGHDGALIRINDAYLEWTPQGQLKAVYSHDQRMELEYGNDTRLDAAYLPSGKIIRYEYAQGLMPVSVLVDLEPAWKYVWKDSLKLEHCIDIQSGISYDFQYKANGIPESVFIQGKPDAIRRLTGRFASDLSIRISVDQIGSIRALSVNGNALKYLEYDAFGTVSLDTRPELLFPLGFAGGLNDFYTGFVRFGFRDYDPQTGRFTAKDPLGDTGGDHDLWDYCVDDPVGCKDSSGLIPFAILAAGLGMLGSAGALALGLGGSRLAAKVTDKAGADGKASEGLNQVRGDVKRIHNFAYNTGQGGPAKGILMDALRQAAKKIMENPTSVYLGPSGEYEGYD